MKFSIVKLLGFLAFFSSINGERSLKLFNPCNQPFICGYGRCESENAKDFTCICPPGLSGRFCEINEKPNCNSFGSSSPCQNGGQCYNTFDRFICHCPEGFYGVVCQFSDPEIPENWGIPSVEDSTLELDEVDKEKGWRLVDEDIIVVTKISTLDELKAQLDGLFEEIRNYTDVQLKFVTYGNGTEFIHSKDCVDAGPRCEWTANLYAMVPEDSTISSSKYIAQLLMDPIFPSHLRPEELSVHDSSDKGPKRNRGLTSIVIAVVVMFILLVLTVFGGLLYTNRGRPFEYGSIKKNNIFSVEERLASPFIQNAIYRQRYFESKIKSMLSGCFLTPEDQQFVKEFRSTEGESAFHTLARCVVGPRTLHVANYLLQMGVDINSVNQEGHTPLLTAAIFKQNELTVWLLNNGANILYQNPRTGFTVLHAAIHTRNVELAQRIAQRWEALGLFQLATRPPCPHSPLTMAASLGLAEILKTILDIVVKEKLPLDGIAGTDMKRMDFTCLHWATMSGSEVCVRMVLDYEKKFQKMNKKYVKFIDRTDFQGRTALQLIVETKSLNVAQILLQAGADPNHVDLLGNTVFTQLEESNDVPFLQHFIALCDNFGHSRKDPMLNKRIHYKPSVQPDQQPMAKQCRLIPMDNRRESVDSGIASANSSFNITNPHNFPVQSPHQQNFMNPCSNGFMPGFDYNSSRGSMGSMGMPYNGNLNRSQQDLMNPMAPTSNPQSLNGSYGVHGLGQPMQQPFIANNTIEQPAMSYNRPRNTMATNGSISLTHLQYPQGVAAPTTTYPTSTLDQFTLNESDQLLGPQNLAQSTTAVPRQVEHNGYPTPNYCMNRQISGQMNQIPEQGYPYNLCSNNWPQSYN